jgi:hypothetical protein
LPQTNFYFMEKYNYKVTDKQFLETFFENDGNYTNTAKALKRKYGVKYTKQSVYERAKKFPKEVEQLCELREDFCEGGLLTFADDEGNDIRLRTRIYINIMNRLSRYNLRRKAEAAKPPVQHEPLVSPYEAEPVDLSDRLMELAMRNKTLTETTN